ncbi:MAG: M23 family metallopeptidase [Bacteroidetes bacterium]|nr:M23 family metallopeptidase [Bacteroidota bacterium]MCH8523454.1 M23 family metallopeptidase [Balneolales bacterium]
MKKLFKRLYELKYENLHLILWKNSDPDDLESFTLKPFHAILSVVTLIVLTSILINAVIFFTPLRYVIFGYDQSFRSELVDISSRILELQDSLNVRDRQLANIRDMIRTTPDTVFTVNRVVASRTSNGVDDFSDHLSLALFNDVKLQRLPDITFEFNRLDEPIFPAASPVNGIISGNHNPAEGHFGIDIAANTGSPIRSIAAGVIVHTDWSINYGYTIKIQHLNGFLSVYKHSTAPTKNIGDFINKGDILGAVSDSGIISSGPHLHFELWQNARPLNPILYLIN